MQQLQAADAVAMPAEAVVEADKAKKEANKGKNDKDCDKDVRARWCALSASWGGLFCW